MSLEWGSHSSSSLMFYAVFAAFFLCFFIVSCFTTSGVSSLRSKTKRGTRPAEGELDFFSLTSSDYQHGATHRVLLLLLSLAEIAAHASAPLLCPRVRRPRAWASPLPDGARGAHELRVSAAQASDPQNPARQPLALCSARARLVHSACRPAATSLSPAETAPTLCTQERSGRARVRHDHRRLCVPSRLQSRRDTRTGQTSLPAPARRIAGSQRR